MNHPASAKADAKANLPGWRASLLVGVLLLAFAALQMRGIYLQGIHDDFLQKKGDARYGRTIEVTAHRGVLSDRNGEPLAVSTPVESVWASPADVEADRQQIRKLAQILDMNTSDLRERLFDDSREFVYLKRRLPPDQTERVAALNIPGVMLQREYRRYYPAGVEAAQTLGFTGQDDIGREGLELSLQNLLAGTNGSQRVIKDRRGHIVEDAGSLQEPRPGMDIVLSLDSRLQHLAYKELEATVRRQHAKSGAVVVLDSRSGEILALANYPGYNPNSYGRTSGSAMRNRAITDLFEPGSTMKPFSIATAIEAGKVNPNTLINTEHGVYLVNNRRIHDAHPETMLTVSQIIQKSSNVGAAKIALSMDSKTLWEGLSGSGFGEQTGVNFPGEASGRLRDPKTWRPIEQATISYGHGISVSLLQLARAYTIFANDGELKPVSLLKVDVPVSGTRVFSERTSKALKQMLESVTQSGGTAPAAQIPGYRVAGKTGTAHKLQDGRYIDKYVASFVGFAPASSPRLVVAVMIDEPDNGMYYGGQVAAPLFSRITGAALHLLNVPNDAPLDNVISSPTEVIREEV
jgi:cell division protein FtsI (penicillin-binding protein 3)